MYTLVWIVSLLIVGMLAGAGTGALLRFTGGRRIRDLAVGQLSALLAGLLLHVADGSATLLPTLVIGTAGAMLATWLTRAATWAPEPKWQPIIVAPPAPMHSSVMTTGEASRLWLTEGRLVAAHPRV